VGLRWLGPERIAGHSTDCPASRDKYICRALTREPDGGNFSGGGAKSG
jgi:hypothetical protein